MKVNGDDSIKNIDKVKVKMLLSVFIVGIIVMSGCIGQPSDVEEEIHVCTCDDVDQTQYEPSSPSQVLLGWISANYTNSGTRKCDRQMLDKFWAHTFTGLEPPRGYHIAKAPLVITVWNDPMQASGHINDHLKIGQITSSNSS